MNSETQAPWLGVPAVPEQQATWSVQVYQDDQALDRLAHEWEDLYRRSATATPFQSVGWLTAWWRHYGREGRLRLFAVRRDGCLVGAAPFMQTRRFGLPVLTPLGAPIADYTDVLVDEEHRSDALRRLAAAMLDQPGWCAADLTELRPDAAGLALQDAWDGPSWTFPGSTCMELPVTDNGDLLQRLSGRTAGKTRARFRKIDAAGFVITTVLPDAAPAAVRRLLRLHARQWEGRAIDPEHLRPRFRGHLEAALPAMIGAGQAAMFEYRLDGRVVAGDLLVLGRSFAGAYLYGSDPELRRKVDVTLMLLRQDMAFTSAIGRPIFSLLRGDEPYKQKWKPVRVRNQRLVLGRGALAAGYAAAVSGRARVAEWDRRRRYVGGHATEQAEQPEQSAPGSATDVRDPGDGAR